MAEKNKNCISIPFGGKVVVLGGDPKQILLVIENGSKAHIINASIISSYLWAGVTTLFLTENMRLKKVIYPMMNTKNWMLLIIGS